MKFSKFCVEMINFCINFRLREFSTSSVQFHVKNFQIFIKIFRCPSLEAMEEMEIKLYSNGDSSVSTFSTSLFQFGDYELSYLHAQVKVCFLEHETCPTKVKIVLISSKNGKFRPKMTIYDKKWSVFLVK